MPMTREVGRYDQPSRALYAQGRGLFSAAICGRQAAPVPRRRGRSRPDFVRELDKSDRAERVPA